jgi:hypothetical protein
MGVRGRKSAVEELQIMQRYAVLAPKYFKVLNKFLDSESKEDNRWANEQLTKAFVKMIPQTVAGDPNNPLSLIFDNSFKNVATPIPKTSGAKSSEV